MQSPASAARARLDRLRSKHARMRGGSPLRRSSVGSGVDSGLSGGVGGSVGLVRGGDGGGEGEEGRRSADNSPESVGVLGRRWGGRSGLESGGGVARAPREGWDGLSGVQLPWGSWGPRVSVFVELPRAVSWSGRDEHGAWSLRPEERKALQGALEDPGACWRVWMTWECTEGEQSPLLTWPAIVPLRQPSSPPTHSTHSPNTPHIARIDLHPTLGASPTAPALTKSTLHLSLCVGDHSLASGSAPLSILATAQETEGGKEEVVEVGVGVGEEGGEESSSSSSSSSSFSSSSTPSSATGLLLSDVGEVGVGLVGGGRRWGKAVCRLTRFGARGSVGLDLSGPQQMAGWVGGKVVVGRTASLTAGECLRPGRNALLCAGVDACTWSRLPLSIRASSALTSPTAPTRLYTLPLRLATLSIVSLLAKGDGRPLTGPSYLGSLRALKSGEWETTWKQPGIPIALHGDAKKWASEGHHLLLFLIAPPRSQTSLPIVVAFAHLPLPLLLLPGSPSRLIHTLRLFPGSPSLLPASPSGDALFEGEPPTAPVDRATVARATAISPLEAPVSSAPLQRLTPLLPHEADMQAKLTPKHLKALPTLPYLLEDPEREGEGGAGRKEAHTHSHLSSSSSSSSSFRFVGVRAWQEGGVFPVVVRVATTLVSCRRAPDAAASSLDAAWKADPSGVRALAMLSEDPSMFRRPSDPVSLLTRRRSLLHNLSSSLLFTIQRATASTPASTPLHPSSSTSISVPALIAPPASLRAPTTGVVASARLAGGVLEGCDAEEAARVDCVLAALCDATAALLGAGGASGDALCHPAAAALVEESLWGEDAVIAPSALLTLLEHTRDRCEAFKPPGATSFMSASGFTDSSSAADATTHALVPWEGEGGSGDGGDGQPSRESAWDDDRIDADGYRGAEDAKVGRWWYSFRGALLGSAARRVRRRGRLLGKPCGPWSLEESEEATFGAPITAAAEATAAFVRAPGATVARHLLALSHRLADASDALTRATLLPSTTTTPNSPPPPLLVAASEWRSTLAWTFNCILPSACALLPPDALLPTASRTLMASGHPAVIFNKKTISTFTKTPTTTTSSSTSTTDPLEKYRRLTHFSSLPPSTTASTSSTTKPTLPPPPPPPRKPAKSAFSQSLTSSLWVAEARSLGSARGSAMARSVWEGAGLVHGSRFLDPSRPMLWGSSRTSSHSSSPSMQSSSKYEEVIEGVVWPGAAHSLTFVGSILTGPAFSIGGRTWEDEDGGGAAADAGATELRTRIMPAIVAMLTRGLDVIATSSSIQPPSTPTTNSAVVALARTRDVESAVLGALAAFTGSFMGMGEGVVGREKEVGGGRVDEGGEGEEEKSGEAGRSGRGRGRSVVGAGLAIVPHLCDALLEAWANGRVGIAAALAVHLSRCLSSGDVALALLKAPQEARASVSFSLARLARFSALQSVVELMKAASQAENVGAARSAWISALQHTLGASPHSVNGAQWVLFCVLVHQARSGGAPTSSSLQATPRITDIGAVASNAVAPLPAALQHLPQLVGSASASAALSLISTSTTPTPSSLPDVLVNLARQSLGIDASVSVPWAEMVATSATSSTLSTSLRTPTSTSEADSYLRYPSRSTSEPSSSSSSSSSTSEGVPEHWQVEAEFLKASRDALRRSSSGVEDGEMELEGVPRTSLLGRLWVAARLDVENSALLRVALTALSTFIVASSTQASSSSSTATLLSRVKGWTKTVLESACVAAMERWDSPAHFHAADALLTEGPGIASAADECGPVVLVHSVRSSPTSQVAREAARAQSTATALGPYDATEPPFGPTSFSTTTYHQATSSHHDETTTTDSSDGSDDEFPASASVAGLARRFNFPPPHQDPTSSTQLATLPSLFSHRDAVDPVADAARCISLTIAALCHSNGGEPVRTVITSISNTVCAWISSSLLPPSATAIVWAFPKATTRPSSLSSSSPVGKARQPVSSALAWDTGLDEAVEAGLEDDMAGDFDLEGDAEVEVDEEEARREKEEEEERRVLGIVSARTPPSTTKTTTSRHRGDDGDGRGKMRVASLPAHACVLDPRRLGVASVMSRELARALSAAGWEGGEGRRVLRSAKSWLERLASDVATLQNGLAVVPPAAWVSESVVRQVFAEEDVELMRTLCRVSAPSTAPSGFISVPFLPAVSRALARNISRSNDVLRRCAPAAVWVRTLLAQVSHSSSTSIAQRTRATAQLRAMERRGVARQRRASVAVFFPSIADPEASDAPSSAPSALRSLLALSASVAPASTSILAGVLVRLHAGPPTPPRCPPAWGIGDVLPALHGLTLATAAAARENSTVSMWLNSALRYEAVSRIARFAHTHSLSSAAHKASLRAIDHARAILATQSDGGKRDENGRLMMLEDAKDEEREVVEAVWETALLATSSPAPSPTSKVPVPTSTIKAYLGKRVGRTVVAESSSHAPLDATSAWSEEERKFGRALTAVKKVLDSNSSSLGEDEVGSLEERVQTAMQTIVRKHRPAALASASSLPPDEVPTLAAICFLGTDVDGVGEEAAAQSLQARWELVRLAPGRSLQHLIASIASAFPSSHVHGPTSPIVVARVAKPNEAHADTEAPHSAMEAAHKVAKDGNAGPSLVILGSGARSEADGLCLVTDESKKSEIPKLSWIARATHDCVPGSTGATLAAASPPPRRLPPHIYVLPAFSSGSDDGTSTAGAVVSFATRVATVVLPHIHKTKSKSTPPPTPLPSTSSSSTPSLSTSLIWTRLPIEESSEHPRTIHTVSSEGAPLLHVGKWNSRENPDDRLDDAARSPCVVIPLRLHAERHWARHWSQLSPHSTHSSSSASTPPLHLPCPLHWVTRRSSASAGGIRGIGQLAAALTHARWATRHLVSMLRWVYACEMIPGRNSVGTSGMGMGGEEDVASLPSDAEEVAAVSAGGGEMGWDGVVRLVDRDTSGDGSSGGGDGVIEEGEGGGEGFDDALRGEEGGDVGGIVGIEDDHQQALQQAMSAFEDALESGDVDVGGRGSADFSGVGIGPVAPPPSPSASVRSGARFSRLLSGRSLGAGLPALDTSGTGMLIPSPSNDSESLAFSNPAVPAGLRVRRRVQLLHGPHRTARASQRTLFDWSAEQDTDNPMQQLRGDREGRGGGGETESVDGRVESVGHSPLRSSRSMTVSGGETRRLRPSPAVHALAPATTTAAASSSAYHASFDSEFLLPSGRSVPTPSQAANAATTSTLDPSIAPGENLQDLGELSRIPLALPRLVDHSSTASPPRASPYLAGRALFASILGAVSPVLGGSGSVRSAQQLLADYAEIKRRFVEKTRTRLRQDYIREMAARAEEATEIPDFNKDLPRKIHSGIAQLARTLAILQRIAGEAIRQHARLCALEGDGPDRQAAAVAAAAVDDLLQTKEDASDAEAAAAAAAAGFLAGRLARRQRRLLLQASVQGLQGSGGAPEKLMQRRREARTAAMRAAAGDFSI